ncbi:hypothetical protein, partial [Flavobacterium sp.]|uniref:hypothetical protein n=1 Tax=Flavobacterium sp. TaxID=239 RepID=UPI003340A7EE
PTKKQLRSGRFFFEQRSLPLDHVVIQSQFILQRRIPTKKQLRSGRFLSLSLSRSHSRRRSILTLQINDYF